MNIALINEGRPVFGVVHVPVHGQDLHRLRGARRGAAGRWRIAAADSRCRRAARSPVRVVGSRSHRGSSLDAFIAKLGDCELVPMGSSLKFCVVAEGGADVYPRLGPTSEWDTAAAQAVVEQAGGSVVTLDGKPMKYNQKEDILNPYFMVIGADRSRLAGAAPRRRVACL